MEPDVATSHRSDAVARTTAGISVAIDPAGSIAAMIGVARDLGARLRLPVRLLHVTDRPAGRQWAEEVAVQAEMDLVVVSGDPVAVLTERARDRCELLVVGLRGLRDDTRGPGHVTRAILLAAEGGVVVVPADVATEHGGIGRVLVGIDDAPQTTAALEPTAVRFRDAGCRVDAVHVIDRSSTPACLDHDGRGAKAWQDEYQARHHLSSWPLTLRRGDPAGSLLAAATPEAADLLVLAWRRQLAPGRAAVLTEVLRTVRVPTLIVPLIGGPPGVAVPS